MTGAGLGDMKPYLRSTKEAMKCRWLGLRLTQAEVLKNQLAGCRTCNNEVRVYHCTNSTFGPFTFPAGQCTSCTGYQPVALPADVAVPADVVHAGDK